jgi:hypothetical protein
MKEIILRIMNPQRDSEKFKESYIQLIIDGKEEHRVKRFAIDISQDDITENDTKVSYTIEKYLNAYEMYYDDTDTRKSPEDWENTRNDAGLWDKK